VLADARKSLYGILACTAVSAFAASLTRILSLGVAALFTDLAIDGGAEWRLAFAACITSFLFAIVLFRLAKRIKNVLTSVFIIPS